MKKARWSQIDAICHAFEAVAGPEIRCWVEDAGDVVAGERPERHFTPCTQRVGGSDQALVLAGVDGRGSAAWIDLFATVVRTTLEQQTTINDMAAASARTWRQMNALLAMASSSSLGLEPGKTIQRIFDMLVRATRFEGGIAVVRLPGSEDCLQLDANGVARVPEDLLAGLEAVGETVRTFPESSEEDEVLRACTALLDPYKPGAVGRLQSDHDMFGWLIAATADTLSSDDLKLFGAAARIIAVALENAHTLTLEREATRTEVERELYQALAKNAPVGMFRADLDGRLLYVNDRWCSVTGVSEGRALQDGWLSAVDEEDQARVTAEWERMLVEGKPLRCEHGCRRDDGQAWVLTEIAREAREDGGYVGTMTDITDHKRAEQEKAELEAQLRHAQTMEAAGAMAGGFVHDFNNILGAIVGDAELAVEGSPEGDRARVHLDRLLQGALRARDLVRQMLTFSKPSHAHSTLREFARLGGRESGGPPPGEPRVPETPAAAPFAAPAAGEEAQQSASPSPAVAGRLRGEIGAHAAGGAAQASGEQHLPLATAEDHSLEDLVATFLAVENHDGAQACAQASSANALVPSPGSALVGADSRALRAPANAAHQLTSRPRLGLPNAGPPRLPNPTAAPPPTDPTASGSSMEAAASETAHPDGEDWLLERLVADFLASEQIGQPGHAHSPDANAHHGNLPAVSGQRGLARGRAIDRAPRAQRGQVKLLGSDRARRLEYDPTTKTVQAATAPRALPQPAAAPEPAPAAHAEPRKLSFPFMIG